MTRLRALRGLAVALLAAASLLGDSAPAARPEPALASLPRDLLVRDAAGREMPLHGLAGKWLVVNVWATWCGPCRQELPSLVRLARLLPEERFEVVALSMDRDPQAALEYLDQRRLELPSYLPADRSRALAALGVDQVPTTFIVAPDGRVAERVVGPRVWDSPAIVADLASLATTAASMR